MVGKLKIFNFFKNRNLFKIKLLIISILIFSILYSFLNDSHFRGLNLIEDALENQLAENKQDQETFAKKTAIELNNGRAAQMGILALMVHEKLDNNPYMINGLLGFPVAFN